jgi:hypothetical protein
MPRAVQKTCKRLGVSSYQFIAIKRVGSIASSETNIGIVFRNFVVQWVKFGEMKKPAQLAYKQ